MSLRHIHFELLGGFYDGTKGEFRGTVPQQIIKESMFIDNGTYLVPAMTYEFTTCRGDGVRLFTLAKEGRDERVPTDGDS